MALSDGRIPAAIRTTLRLLLLGGLVGVATIVPATAFGATDAGLDAAEPPARDEGDQAPQRDVIANL
jgi:hypothetical protein